MNTLTNRRILLIDDTPSIHEDFHRILPGNVAVAKIDAAERALFGDDAATRAGFEVDDAYQGREGLEKVRASLQAASPYALAFVDMRMPPGWDGVETIQEMWKVDPRLQIVICTAHSDYSWTEVLGKVGADDRLLVLKKPFDTIEVAQMASALTTKWNMTRQAELKVSRLEDAVRERTGALQIANQELEQLVRDATRLAHHDALTGLPNRLLFGDRATQALAVARRDATRPAVLMLDLDRFKEINDTLGHQHGDLLLTQVAQRLSEVLRPGDTVARFGGDEFAFLLPDAGSDAGTVVAVRIAKALEDPFILGDAVVGVEASIGIATAAANEHSPLEELLRRADIAMYKAKGDRSGIAHFTACDDDGTPDRLTLMGELRQAIECEQLVVYYQPKISLGTGELLGVEALVRWEHPTRGLLLPAEFLPAAEGSTLIKRLTTFVLDHALDSCHTWLDHGVNIPVSVNVSARSLCDPDFATVISERLAYANVPAELLTIELSDTNATTYVSLAPGSLQALRDIGVQLSLGDYGSRYLTMAYLKNLPITELKIDRAFIQGLTSDVNDAVIVQSVTELGHNLGLTVIAEGVEDQPTLTIVKALGIDIAQGFHIGHPMPEHRLLQWITDRTNGTAPFETIAHGSPPSPTR